MKDKRLKREEAEKRQEIYNSLSIDEKIDKLNKKYGKNKGAKKQREKLKKLKERKNETDTNI